MKRRIIIMIGIIIFISLNFVSAVTNITSCTDITISGEYNLNASISTGVECIVIESSDVIFDCKGFSIIGLGEVLGPGFGVQGLDVLQNVTIKNCNISGFPTGIDFTDVNVSYIINNTIYNRNYTNEGNYPTNGIYIGRSGSEDVIYEGNAVVDNVITTFVDNTAGIFLETNITLTNITSNNITTFGTNSLGIYLTGANSNTINSNTITNTGSAGDGIYIYFSAYNSLTNNIFNTTNGFAIWVAGLVAQDYNHTIINNTEQGNNIYYLFNNDSGIIENENVGEIFAASSNNLTLNNLTLNYDGITFILTDNSTIKNSNIFLSGTGIHWGIGFSGSYYNNITNNTITTSASNVDGIYLEDTNHSTFTQNKIYITGNESFVIYVKSSASGNNTFYNNLFNASTINSLSPSGFGYEVDTPTDFFWNITKTTGTNIVGKSYIGGNYWTNNASTGYSDTCIDADGDYICDTSYSFNDNTDYLPLTIYATKVSDCRNITLSNTLHTLNQSITGNGTCINIAANNITLNFNGFNITGNTTGEGVAVIGYNSTKIMHGLIYNFSNGVFLNNSQNNNITNITLENNNMGLYIDSSSNNIFSNITINASGQNGIYLIGTVSSNNNFTEVTVLNTNSSYYDIDFATEGINGTWIIDSYLTSYAFTGAGGIVNFKVSGSAIVEFLEPINGSGTNLTFGDFNVESNLVFVNSSNNVGINKSANITLYTISYTDPKPQYSSNGVTFADCTAATNPACSELGFSGNVFKFNTTHFTYFRSAEAYVAPLSSSGGGGGGAVSYWTKTYTITDEQFKEGYTKDLGVKHRIIVNIDNESHYVGVVELTNITAKINVSSTPQQATLAIGDVRRFDVTENGYYDLVVTLNEIADNKANVTILSVSEKVTEETIKEEQDKEKNIVDKEETEEKKRLEETRSIAWVWIIIVVIVLILIGARYKIKKNKK